MPRQPSPGSARPPSSLGLELASVKAVVEQLPQPSLLLDAAGAYVGANPPARALFGAGVTLLEVPEQRQRILSVAGRPLAVDQLPGVRALAGASVEREVLTIARPDGSRVTVEASASAIRSAGGAVLGAVVTYADVTDREAARREREFLLQVAERSSRDFRDLAEAIPQVVWTSGPDGVPDYFNRRGSTYTGLSFEALRKRGLEAATHPDDSARVAQRWAEARARGTTFEAEVRGRGADGTYRWFLLRAVPRRSAEGEVLGWFGTATDIHEQKLSEIRSGFIAAASEQLAGSLDYEETLRRVAQLAVPRFADWTAVDLLDGGAIKRVAVAHVDPEKARFGWELSRRFPAKVEDPAGLARVLRTGEPDFIREITDEVLRGGISDPDTLAIFRALELRSWITAPMIVRGRTLGAVSFVLAGSERRYEQADLAIALELGRRAAMAVENARLYRDSEAANRAKDEFLAVVSHELRTPLTAVLGYTSMLRSGTLPEARRERAIEVIDRNVRVQAKLIEDLLDLSRIISGKLRLTPRMVDLREVAEAALESVRPAAEARGVQITASLEPRVPPISGDPDRLQQVAWNLLSNAIKFTRAGGRVSLCVRPLQDQVELAVQDTGQGIARAFLPFVFDRFRQGDASATRSHGGLGLGLAIVRHMVELHGGTVEAESGGEGRGATFRVRLPVRRADAEPAEHGDPPVPGRALKDRKVLVVDDDPDTREMLATLLARAGAEPVTSGSAAEARVRAGSERFDLVVCDLGMPGEDGLSFIRWLRAQPAAAGGHTPAMALTAYVRDEDRAQALQAGFTAHLGKPIEPDAAVARMAELLHAG